jgi:hypothetical protein
MPSMLNEALEWLDRAEQAREVAGQLTDPTARKAVLQLAESSDRLARAAATRLCSAEGSWRLKTTNETGDFPRAFLSQTASAPLEIETNGSAQRVFNLRRSGRGSWSFRTC